MKLTTTPLDSKLIFRSFETMASTTETKNYKFNHTM
jgi:hypothetical protein